MGRKKQLKELTIKDNFMFGAVMMDEDNCKGLLERVLQIPIDHMEICKEKKHRLSSGVQRSAARCVCKR